MTAFNRFQEQEANDPRWGYEPPPQAYPDTTPPRPRAAPQRAATVRYTSHVVTADQLAKGEPRARQFLALLIWMFSLWGTMLSFGGSVLTENAAWSAMAMALLYQLIASGVQFITCKRWRNPLYLVALFASVVPSFIGYRQYTALPLIKWLFAVEYDAFASVQTFGAFWATNRDMAGMLLLIHAVVFVGFVLVDIIPERIFVAR